MSKGSRKGSSFEREVCKKLSLWWSYGKRDDVFWRSSQSGGRATERRKKGKSTFGSYGDVAAVDPVGLPLLDLFTIELKVGKSHGHPIDIMDAPDSAAVRRWESTLFQTIQSHRNAKSLSWMLICKRDRRLVMVYVDSFWISRLRQFARQNGHHDILSPPCARYDMILNGDRKHRCRYFAVRFDDFFNRLSPKSVVKALHSQEFMDIGKKV